LQVFLPKQVSNMNGENHIKPQGTSIMEPTNFKQRKILHSLTGLTHLSAFLSQDSGIQTTMKPLIMWSAWSQ